MKNTKNRHACSTDANDMVAYNKGLVGIKNTKSNLHHPSSPSKSLYSAASDDWSPIEAEHSFY